MLLNIVEFLISIFSKDFKLSTKDNLYENNILNKWVLLNNNVPKLHYENITRLYRFGY